MAHASDIVTGIRIGDPLAFFNVPLCPRNGALDGPCADCEQHGQWNIELDLVSMRCKRAICDTCLGAGWVETGNDARAIPDIILSESGHPQWILRYFPGR